MPWMYLCNHYEHNIAYHRDSDKKRVFFIKISFCYSPRSFSHVFTSSLLKLLGKRSLVIQFPVFAFARTCRHRCVECYHVFAGKIIVFDKAVHNPHSFTPADRIVDKDGIIALKI